MSTQQYPNDGPDTRRTEQPATRPTYLAQPSDTQPYDRPEVPRSTTQTPITQPPAAQTTLRRDVVAKEKDEFGGVKIGSAFFGWLTAVGTMVLLGAIVAGVIALLGINLDANSGAVDDAVNDATSLGVSGIIGAIVAVVVVFIAYFCGGYVAGRMARFSGAKQGIAVWVWSIVIGIVVSLLAVGFSSQLGTISELSGMGGMPADTFAGDNLVTSIVTLVVAIVVSLGGALLGGLAGMRFHRRVDRAGLGR